LEEIQRKAGLPELKDYLIPGRVYTRDGKLKVQVTSIKFPDKGKRKEERHLVLFNDLFLHVRKKLFDTEKIEEDSVWPLELVWIEEASNKVKLLGPTSDQLTFTNKQGWAQTLKETLEAHLAKSGKSVSPARVGKFKFVDGSIYKGQWVEGKREGKGVWKYNGATYNGMER